MMVGRVSVLSTEYSVFDPSSQLLVQYRTKGVRGWREMKANQTKLDAEFQRQHTYKHFQRRGRCSVEGENL